MLSYYYCHEGQTQSHSSHTHFQPWSTSWSWSNSPSCGWVFSLLVHSGKVAVVALKIVCCVPFHTTFPKCVTQATECKHIEKESTAFAAFENITSHIIILIYVRSITLPTLKFIISVSLLLSHLLPSPLCLRLQNTAAIAVEVEGTFVLCQGRTDEKGKEWEIHILLYDATYVRSGSSMLSHISQWNFHFIHQAWAGAKQE